MSDKLNEVKVSEAKPDPVEDYKKKVIEIISKEIRSDARFYRANGYIPPNEFGLERAIEIIKNTPSPTTIIS